jgi:MFS transporter, YNFM family, putative membrane transport protein
LAQPPYALTPGAISLIFLTYTGGMFASPLAGQLAVLFGRRLVLMFGLGLMGLGALITLKTHLQVIIAGVLFVTLGFFIAHAIASTWVGQLSGRRRSYGSSLYLLSYYSGASISGIVAGICWHAGGWAAVIALVEVMAIFAVISAYTLGRQAHYNTDYASNTANSR